MNMDEGMIPRRGASLDVERLGSFNTKIPFNKIYNIVVDESNMVGEGGFGSVYKTHHVDHSEEPLAVKVVSNNYEIDKQDFLNEVEFLRRLRDVPYVVGLVDFYVELKYIYSVQKLANGGDLLDRLMDKGRYTERECRLLGTNLLNALDCIHKNGIVHRDLKLENILLKSEDNDHDILLCDFGCAKNLPHNGILYTMIGTDALMAPEMVQGEGYGSAVEFWSAGCILYCLLGGYMPFGEVGDRDLFSRIIDCDYEFEEDCWDVITEDAKELIRNFFRVQPSERWTAKQALQSNWFSPARRRARNSSLGKKLALFETDLKEFVDADETETATAAESTDFSIGSLEEEIACVCIGMESDDDGGNGGNNNNNNRKSLSPIAESPESVEQNQNNNIEDAATQSERMIRFQAVVRGFLGRTNYKMQRLQNHLMETKQKETRELEEIQNNKLLTFQKLKEKLEIKTHQQRPWDQWNNIMGDGIDRSMAIIKQLKQEYETLSACHAEALRCKKNLQDQQEDLRRSIEHKEDHIQQLKSEKDDLEKLNKHLLKTSSVLKDTAQALIQKVNADIRRRSVIRPFNLEDL